MPKVNGPLLSLSAAGTVGGVLNFKRWGNISCVRFHKKPKTIIDANTEKQKFVREYFNDVVKTWQNLNSIEKLELDKIGNLSSQSGFNFYNRVQILEPETEFGLARFGFSDFGGLTP